MKAQQNVQGAESSQQVADLQKQLMMDSRESERSQEDEILDRDDQEGECQSQGDLLSSPRHSELSLISESTTEHQRLSHLGASHQSRKEVRDPNFIQIQDGGHQHKHNNTRQTNRGEQQWLQQQEIFAPSNEAQLQMYQTQQQKNNLNLGSTMGAQTIENRLSQIMHRQSYPQGPITDRKRDSNPYRDSMVGARQGLQGAGNGGSIIQQHQAQNNFPQRIHTGISNDRHSSVQFVLSQSGDGNTMTTSQNNANINVENQRGVPPVYLQWSLTQSGLDSVENESQATKQQMAQNFQSANSFNPTIKSEDYQSQFNSVSIAKLTDAINSHSHLRQGEHQKPIIVNSMGPMTADFTPSSSIHLIPSVEKSSEFSNKDKQKPQQQIEFKNDQQAAEQDLYDNILSSPSVQNTLENSVENDNELSSVTKKDLKSSGNINNNNPSHQLPVKLFQDQSSVSQFDSLQSPLPDCSNQPLDQTQQIDLVTQQSDYHTVTSMTLMSPEEADNVSPYPETSVKQIIEQPTDEKNEKQQYGHPADTVTVSMTAQCEAQPNLNQLKANTTQSTCFVEQQNDLSQIEGDEESEAEDGVAMISVRATTEKKTYNDQGSATPASNNIIQLPLPHELFNNNEFSDNNNIINENDNRPSEQFDQQPTLSAKVILPKAIFQDQEEDQQQQKTSQFQIEALESVVKLQINQNQQDLTPIDYRNLPIDMSNALLLQQAASSSRSSQVQQQEIDPEVTNDQKPISETTADQILENTSNQSPCVEVKRKVKVAGSSSRRRGLEISQLTMRQQEDNKKQPLILTDQQHTSEGEEFQDSSVSIDDHYQNNQTVGSSVEEEQELQPALKPEELFGFQGDHSFVNRHESKQDSNSIILVPDPDDKLIEVSEMNQKQGGALTREKSESDGGADGHQTFGREAEGDQVISYVLSRQTSQESARDQSPSLVFSQTNQNRMTLTSMMYTQEKQFQNQPSTTRKHHNRAQIQQFPQTSEKKGQQKMLANTQQVPSLFFAASQSNNDVSKNHHNNHAIPEMRQQSCSSFNNTSHMLNRDDGGPTSNASRQSYFVNALGQRISSEVFCDKDMMPADATLKNLFNNNQHHHLQQQPPPQFQLLFPPVQEFAGGQGVTGGETMSTIPDESQPHKQQFQQQQSHQQQMQLSEQDDFEGQLKSNDMIEYQDESQPYDMPHNQRMIKQSDMQNIQVGQEILSAPGYPSTTMQSVTEMNFNSNSHQQTTTQTMPQMIGSSQRPRNPSFKAQVSAASVSDLNKNINTVGVRQMTLNEDTRDEKNFEEGQEDDIIVKRNLNLHEAFKTQNLIVPQHNNNHRIKNQSLYHEPQQENDSSEDSPSEMVKSSARPMQNYQEQLPVFKSHDNMKKSQSNRQQAKIQQLQNNNNHEQAYSLEAQQNFYQRYNSIRAAGGHNAIQNNNQLQASINNLKSSTTSTVHNVMMNKTEPQGMLQNMVLGPQFNNGEDDYRNDSNSRYFIDEPSALQESLVGERKVTQEYFQEEYQQQLQHQSYINSNQHHYQNQTTQNTNNDQILDDLTDEDIAVFRSQLNDIPADIAQQPIRRQLQTNVQPLMNRHETTFLMSIEESDPINMLILTNKKSNSVSKTHNKSKRSRGVSLSNYIATDEDITGKGGNIGDRLSPKFEKLQQLMSMPSHKEHIKSTKLMLRTMEPTQVDGGILSPPLASNPVSKSFLHRIAQSKGYQQQQQQNHQNESQNVILSPASSNMQPSLKNFAMYPPPPNEAHSPGHLSEDDTTILPTLDVTRGRALPEDNQIMARDCMTTTNQEAKKRPSLISAMYRQEGGFVGASQTSTFLRKDSVPQTTIGNKKQQNSKKRAGSGRPPSEQHHLPISQFTVKKEDSDEQMSHTMISRQTESVPRNLQKWLSSLSLSQYGPLLVEQGLDDLESLVQMMGQDRVLPLTHEVLEAAGIQISGHRARILVNLELEAGVFEQNPEVMNLMQGSTMNPEEIARQADILFQAGGADQMSNQDRIRQSHQRATPDHESRFAASPMPHSPLTEQILKGRADRSPLRPQISSSKLAGQLSLSNWLAQNNLITLQPLFIRSGYECLRSLILQSFSQFNKISDNMLKTEIGIDKIGHRMRILSQLRQDALVLFQMEMLYRSCKQSQRNSAVPLTQEVDNSMFTLPNAHRQQSQGHFKSVYTDTNPVDNSMMQQHTQSQKYLLPVAHQTEQQQKQQIMPPEVDLSTHHHMSHQIMPNMPASTQHHMSQQQPLIKNQTSKTRVRNYSFSKLNVESGTSESVPSSLNTTLNKYQQQVPRAGTGINNANSSIMSKKQSHQSKSNYSYIKDHLESNLNPWRHSTYFDQSRPISQSQSSSQQKYNKSANPNQNYLPKSNTVNNDQRNHNHPFNSAAQIVDDSLFCADQDESLMSHKIQPKQLRHQQQYEQQIPPQNQQKNKSNSSNSRGQQQIILMKQLKNQRQQLRDAHQKLPTGNNTTTSAARQKNYDQQNNIHYQKKNIENGNVDKSCVIF